MYDFMSENEGGGSICTVRPGGGYNISVHSTFNGCPQGAWNECELGKRMNLLGGC